MLISQRTQVVDLVAKSRLPAMYNVPEFVEANGLMTYGPIITDLSRRAAVYVDKILKGCQTRRSPSGTADEVRVRHQSKSREANRGDDSAECAGAGGQGGQVTTMAWDSNTLAARGSASRFF